ncbi:RNA-directed DNA polymerase from transposon x-element [Botrytis cinerea]
MASQSYTATDGLQPTTDEVIDYVASLALESQCLVDRNFNSRNDFHHGAELVGWSFTSGMNHIGITRDPTQRSGHVLDLSFSKIPFTNPGLCGDMHTGSDHVTQVTIVPDGGNFLLERFNYWVPETE